MWVLAGVCPTIGSQLGQSPTKYSHFCLIQLTHGKKGEDLDFFQNHYSYFYLKYRQYSQNRDIYGSFKTIQFPFKTIAIFCINPTFWPPFHPNQAKTSPNTLKFKFSNSIVSIVPIVHPCEQIWWSVKHKLNSQ